MNKERKRNTYLVVGAFVILGLLSVSNLLMVTNIIPLPVFECPYQNEYWVVSTAPYPFFIEGEENKTIQSYTRSSNMAVHLAGVISVVWYTDYTGIAEPITRGIMKDWHIQTNIDMHVKTVNDDLILVVTVYHPSNEYPETYEWSILYGNYPDAYFKVSALGQDVIVTLNDAQILNLGIANSFDLTLEYFFIE